MLDPFPSSQPALLVYVQDPGPNYAQAPSVIYPTYQEIPALADLLLTEGHRMGITMKAGHPELPGKDATYRVKHGPMGSITIKQRLISSKVVRCALINHEFMHVLLHL